MKIRFAAKRKLKSKGGGEISYLIFHIPYTRNSQYIPFQYIFLFVGQMTQNFVDFRPQMSYFLLEIYIYKKYEIFEEYEIFSKILK